MSTDQNPVVFVIIVTYNGAQWVDKCFGSLRQSNISVKTIVVDNQSTDDCISKIRQFYPEVDIINSPENLGFGKANNLGILKAMEQGADYVFLLNQDAWIMPDTIERLVATHAANPQYYVLSPMHLDGTEKKLDFGFSLYISPYHCKNIVSDLILKNGTERAVYTTTFVNAAFWLISREGLESVGLFDPIFPHYGEDDDYMHRVMYHGGHTGICPAAFGCHDRVQELAEVKKFPYDKRYKRQIVGCLITLMNINRSFYHCLMVFMRSRIEFFFSAFLKLRLKEAFLEMKVFFVILLQMTEIIRHRNHNKKRGSWLKN